MSRCCPAMPISTGRFGLLQSMQASLRPLWRPWMENFTMRLSTPNLTPIRWIGLHCGLEQRRLTANRRLQRGDAGVWPMPRTGSESSLQALRVRGPGGCNARLLLACGCSLITINKIVTTHWLMAWPVRLSQHHPYCRAHSWQPSRSPWPGYRSSDGLSAKAAFQGSHRFGARIGQSVCAGHD